MKSHSLVTTLTCNCNDVRNLKVYYHDEKPHLTVAGYFDNTIKIWCLTEYELISVLGGHEHHVSSLVVINDDNNKKVLLASGDLSGYVKVWDMKLHDCILSFETYHDGGVTGLEVIRNWGETCLVTSSCHSMNIRVWDLDDGSMIACIDSKGYGVRAVKAFMNQNRPCLAIAYDYDEDPHHHGFAVKLWTEDQK